MRRVADIELDPRKVLRARHEAQSGPLGRLRLVWRVTHDATGGLFRHDGVMVASAIAFSLIFALFPFAIFVVALGTILGGADLATYLRGEAMALLPDEIFEAVEPELERLLVFSDRASPLTIGLFITLVSITGAVEAIRDGLNRAYGCVEDRHLLRRYLSSLLFVFVGMLFLLTVATLGVVVPIWLDMLDRFFLQPDFELGFLETGREVLLVLATTAVLFAFHLFLPARRRRFSSVVAGVLVTLVAWWLSAKAFGLYISEIANYSAIYAGLAGVVVLMFFLYIQALIFLYGAELNRSIADHRGQPLCRVEG